MRSVSNVRRFLELLSIVGDMLAREHVNCLLDVVDCGLGRLHRSEKSRSLYANMGKVLHPCGLVK